MTQVPIRAPRPPRAARRTRVLFLETDLEEDLSSHRSQIPFMREFFVNYPAVELVARQVHSRSGLEKFLDVARRDPMIKMLHLVAHGPVVERARTITLTHGEDVDLAKRDNLNLFRDLHTEAIVLSCCRLGRERAIMRRLVETSGAQAVFSYTGDLEDWQAYLIETLLYHLAFGAQAGERDWRDIYERLKFGVAHFKIDPSATALSRPLLVADFAPEPKRQR